MMTKLLGLLTFTLVLATAGAAHADEIPQAVQKAFRGQFVITDGPLPAAGGDKETIAAIKKAQLKELAHRSESEGVAEWSFDYTIFFKKAPGVSSLSIDFHTADKAKRYVANKGLMGVDRKTPILSGTLTINEDDGPSRGNTYLIKVTGKVKGRTVTFAETKLKLK